MTVYPITLISDAHAGRREVVVFDGAVPVLAGRVTFHAGRYAVEGYDLFDEEAGELIEGLTWGVFA